jgi:superfamily II DNA or RNA helicase
MAGQLEEAGLLRDYQAEAVTAAFTAPAWRSIVQAPAGSGKTHMAAGLVAVGAQLGICRWVYLVQNQGLAEQTRRKFETVIPEMVAVVGECDWRMVCGSYGTIGDAVEEAQGLIVDECHLLAAPTRAAAVARAMTAEFRCGLSATPLLRQDAGNALVIGLLGPVRFSLDPEAVIAAGNLAQGRYHVVEL